MCVYVHIITFYYHLIMSSSDFIFSQLFNYSVHRTYIIFIYNFMLFVIYIRLLKNNNK